MPEAVITTIVGPDSDVASVSTVYSGGTVWHEDSSKYYRSLYPVGEEVEIDLVNFPFSIAWEVDGVGAWEHAIYNSSPALKLSLVGDGSCEFELFFGDKMDNPNVPFDEVHYILSCTLTILTNGRVLYEDGWSWEESTSYIEGVGFWEPTPIGCKLKNEKYVNPYPEWYTSGTHTYINKGNNCLTIGWYPPNIYHEYYFGIYHNGYDREEEGLEALSTEFYIYNLKVQPYRWIGKAGIAISLWDGTEKPTRLSDKMILKYGGYDLNDFEGEYVVDPDNIDPENLPTGEYISWDSDTWWWWGDTEWPCAGIGNGEDELVETYSGYFIAGGEYIYDPPVEAVTSSDKFSFYVSGDEGDTWGFAGRPHSWEYATGWNYYLEDYQYGGEKRFCISDSDGTCYLVRLFKNYLRPYQSPSSSLNQHPLISFQKGTFVGSYSFTQEILITDLYPGIQTGLYEEIWYDDISQPIIVGNSIIFLWSTAAWTDYSDPENPEGMPAQIYAIEFDKMNGNLIKNDFVMNVGAESGEGPWFFKFYFYNNTYYIMYRTGTSWFHVSGIDLYDLSDSVGIPSSSAAPSWLGVYGDTTYYLVYLDDLDVAAAQIFPITNNIPGNPIFVPSMRRRIYKDDYSPYADYSEYSFWDYESVTTMWVRNGTIGKEGKIYLIADDWENVISDVAGPMWEWSWHDHLYIAYYDIESEEWSSGSDIYPFYEFTGLYYTVLEEPYWLTVNPFVRLTWKDEGIWTSYLAITPRISTGVIVLSGHTIFGQEGTESLREAGLSRAGIPNTKGTKHRGKYGKQ
jgi:hypothetical protein